MTGRSDLRRLAGSLATLGTELEQKGETVWDRLGGWEPGPEPAPSSGVRGGGGSEADLADRREERRQARRATVHMGEWRADLKILDDVVQRLFHLIDMACPPDMSEARNRRTGEFDPETATDALAAGFCPNCWSHGIRQVPLSPVEGKSQIRRYGDRCRPCGDFRKTEGFDKPKELVAGHARIPQRRFSPEEYQAIVAAERARLNPPKKGKKAKRSKKGKAA